MSPYFSATRNPSRSDADKPDSAGGRLLRSSSVVGEVIVQKSRCPTPEEPNPHRAILAFAALRIDPTSRIAEDDVGKKVHG